MAEDVPTQWSDLARAGDLITLHLLWLALRELPGQRKGLTEKLDAKRKRWSWHIERRRHIQKRRFISIRTRRRMRRRLATIRYRERDYVVELQERRQADDLLAKWIVQWGNRSPLSRLEKPTNPSKPKPIRMPRRLTFECLVNDPQHDSAGLEAYVARLLVKRAPILQGPPVPLDLDLLAALASATPAVQPVSDNDRAWRRLRFALAFYQLWVRRLAPCNEAGPPPDLRIDPHYKQLFSAWEALARLDAPATAPLNGSLREDLLLGLTQLREKLRVPEKLGGLEATTHHEKLNLLSRHYLNIKDPIINEAAPAVQSTG